VFDDLPRAQLATLPTPLERGPMLPGDVQLWVKRDDLTGLAGGGNKARKLEWLCADALAHECDTVLTGGAPQSNHVRMAASACARLGLRFVGVLFGHPPPRVEGNLVLDQLLGADIRWAGAGRAAGVLDRVEDELAASGARVYRIPLGGSSPVGAQGYVACADELRVEAPEGFVVVCADGSGGTHAGLVAGLGDHERVLGVNVGFDDLDPKVSDLAKATAALAGRAEPQGRLQLDPGQPEPYGEPTRATRDAMQLAARTEGLVLDPVYTGRCLAALVHRARAGAFGDDRPVVFLHSGGLPALFTSRYRAWFPSWPGAVHGD
jgi:D-cysteine desulfhydrase